MNEAWTTKSGKLDDFGPLFRFMSFVILVVSK